MNADEIETELEEACATVERQAKRIAELEGNLAEEKDACLALAKQVAEATKLKESIQKNDYDIINKQRSTLKKLGKAKRARGKALVEERANSIWMMNATAGRLIDRLAADRLARAQLRQEGKL